jgi:hypothetical protein
MVSERCKMAIKEELKKLGLHFVIVDLGEVEIMETLNTQQKQQLQIGLQAVGLELMDDRRAILIERIKTAVIEMVHYKDEPVRINFSEYLSEKLEHDYNYLSNIFGSAGYHH